MKDKALSIILVSVCVFCMTSNAFAKLELKLKDKQKTNELNKTEVSSIYISLEISILCILNRCVIRLLYFWVSVFGVRLCILQDTPDL